METQLAEARGQFWETLAPLRPQPPHLPEGEEQPSACQHKRETCSGMRLPQGMGLHVPVQKHVGFVAAWGPCHAAALASHGLWVTACTGRILLIRNPSGRPVARVWSRLISLPAVVREAEPYQLGVPQPSRAGRPWQLQFQAAGRQ